MLHYKLKSIVARNTTFALNFSRNKFHCCKLRQHVLQSRPELLFLQQAFNFIFRVKSCDASQRLWLVDFSH